MVLILTANLERTFAPDPTPNPMNLFTLKVEENVMVRYSNQQRWRKTINFYMSEKLFVLCLSYFLIQLLDLLILYQPQHKEQCLLHRPSYLR